MPSFSSLKHTLPAREHITLRKKGILLLSVVLGLIPAGLIGQTSGGGGEAHPTLTTNPASLQRWKDMRFGMFIHWGPVTLRGTEIGWSRGPQVRIEDYDSLFTEFNPVLFSAKEWVGAAKVAGMKYLVITSKHHDGFCLWDSKYTDYDIMSTPIHRDVLKELSDECSRQGVLFGTYYSILDWHHPHYTTRYGGDRRPVQSSDMNQYRIYLKNHIRELIATYRTNILWCDGEWEQSWTHDDGMDLYAYARGLNEALLINNRVDKGRAGMKGMTTSAKFAGDFGTPEQEIGLFDNHQPWESCITIGTQWSWKPNDKLKTLRECIQMLARTAGGGGNLLLNVSPMPDGRIEKRQVDRLRGIGQWLERYGESIYGTMGGPFKPTSWMVSTCKGNRIYVHLLTQPKDEVRLPLIPRRKVTGVRVLGSTTLQWRSTEDQVVVSLPLAPMEENDAVIVLDLDGATGGIAPRDVPANVFKNADAGAVRLTFPPSSTYPGHGAKSLTDRVRGTLDYFDEHWLGFEKDDCEAVIDLHAATPITKVVVGCLQTQNSWIFFPTAIDVLASMDSVEFKTVGRIAPGEPTRDESVSTKDFAVPLGSVTARYVKVRVSNVGVCPAWHTGAGGKAWLFVDELAIEK